MVRWIQSNVMPCLFPPTAEGGDHPVVANHSDLVHLLVKVLLERAAANTVEMKDPLLLEAITARSTRKRRRTAATTVGDSS